VQQRVAVGIDCDIEVTWHEDLQPVIHPPRPPVVIRETETVSAFTNAHDIDAHCALEIVFDLAQHLAAVDGTNGSALKSIVISKARDAADVNSGNARPAEIDRHAVGFPVVQGRDDSLSTVHIQDSLVPQLYGQNVFSSKENAPDRIPGDLFPLLCAPRLTAKTSKPKESPKSRFHERLFIARDFFPGAD
jgi:hypothetical protein